MDTAGWATLLGGLSGVSGLAALMKVVSDARKKVSPDLTSTLSTTARDWVTYIDGKFDKVSEELENHKRDAAANERIRKQMTEIHREWDMEVKTRLEQITGQPLADPPPLDPPVTQPQSSTP